MPDTLCPVTGGLHQKRPWASQAPRVRSGFSCRACHKTWEWVNTSPDHVACVPTYDLLNPEPAT